MIAEGRGTVVRDAYLERRVHRAVMQRCVAADVRGLSCIQICTAVTKILKKLQEIMDCGQLYAATHMIN